MARTSRRVKKETVVKPQATVCPTAIYARLSVENSGKDDNGAAIENQIAVCREYVSGCADLEVVRVFQDNGWTGTNMNRPAFDEMMEEVRAGRIRAIVVRDLSRFARNYIEMGTYLETIFPMLDVRFISVKEQFDTQYADRSNESLMVPLQSLINELYSKDISRKIQAAFEVQRENGEYSWRQVPYGYRMDREQKNIVPFGEEAEIVKKLFEWKIGGVSYVEMIRRLNSMGAKTYFQKRGRDTSWNAATIVTILSNPVYVGKRVFGYTRTEYYRGRKTCMLPEEEWYVIENSHEAVITEAQFETVNAMLKETSERHKALLKKSEDDRAKLLNLFKGKIFCADCGGIMYFHRHKVSWVNGGGWYGNYVCSTYNNKKTVKCTSHGISKRKLDDKVLSVIKNQIQVALDYEKVLMKFRQEKGRLDSQRKLDASVKELKGRLNKLKNRRKNLYEDYVQGILNEKEYLYAKKKYEAEDGELTALYENACAMKRKCRETLSDDNKWIALMKRAGNADTLTQELVDMAIERINVYEGGNIEIIMRYQDVYELTLSYVGEIEGVDCFE